MIKKTLGGDRLGSGAKMDVHLHNYERATFDLSYLWRSTMAPGTLVPFLCKPALPGDTFDIQLDGRILTLPTIGPLFGSYKAQFDVFVCPIRLYQSLLHNNKLGVGMSMKDVFLPTIEFTGANVPSNVSDLDNAQVNPSSLPAYLGVRGIGIKKDGGAITRSFNGVPFIAYWDIYKNYYANKQEGIGAVIHTASAGVLDGVIELAADSSPVPEAPASGTAISLGNGSTFQITWDTGVGAFDISTIYIIDVSGNVYNLYDLVVPGSVGTLGGGIYHATYNFALYDIINISQWRYASSGDVIPQVPQVSTFDLDNIDTMRESILTDSQFSVNSVSLPPYSWLVGVGADSRPNIQNTMEGLAVKTYQSDLFNNWLATEWISGPNGVSALSAIDTSSGEITVDAINLAQKVYNMLNRIAVSGGSYDDWLEAVYAHRKFTIISSPVYCGGLSKELVFQEVISNAQSETQPLGTLAGRGVLSSKHKGGYIHVKVDEPSYIIGLVSLTPRIDYSQGNEWDIHLKTMDDFHKPALDEIGFQDLITERMAWWDSYYDPALSKWVQNSAGKQPAWIEYMTSVNKVLGNFAIPTKEMFMTLNRRYEPQFGGGRWNIADLTTYVDPQKFNHIFAETNLDAQNFWCQIAVDITARRKMSAKMMPNM